MSRIGSPPVAAPLLAALLSLSGCSDDRGVVVATGWDRSACRQFESDWRQAIGDPSARIDWIRLDPWDDPARLLDAGRPIDLVLAWPEPTLAALDSRGLLDPSSAVRWPGPGGPIGHLRSPFPIGDPRFDPSARDAVASLLSRSTVTESFESLLLRDEQVEESHEDTKNKRPLASLGAALTASSRHPQARGLLDFARQQFDAEPRPRPTETDPSPESLALSAELIGATLIDAGEELRLALEALGRSPDAHARTALIEPPPWPPTSIQRLAQDESLRDLDLIGTLAEALVDDPPARAVLVESWQRAPRPVDRAVLDMLATAEGGRLIRSSRVLPWLRAEWSAWARQHYRQVARTQAAGPGEARR